MEAEKVLYVVVIYKQSLYECNAYKTLLAGKRHVYIQDNSPWPNVPDELPEGWHYTVNSGNPGLSVAYNAAAQYAKDRGIEWLLIADQDTRFTSAYSRNMAALPSRYPDERIFIPQLRLRDGLYMSPAKKHGYFTRPSKNMIEGAISLRDYAIINSGLMVSVHAFMEAGGYNENVPLDFSDFQFIERLSKVCPSGMAVDYEGLQSFSKQDDDKETKLNRFKKLCESLSGFESSLLMGKQMLRAVVMKRALRLMVETRSMQPLKTMINSYK